MTIEVLKLIASFLTPIIILLLGLIISKGIERNKIALLQEKEWQVRWAETFLIRAIKFDENVSVVVASIGELKQNMQNKNATEAKQNEKEIIKTINQSIANIRYLDWDIQNFAQFADNHEDMIKIQHELMDTIKEIFAKKQADLERIRKIQFEYNKEVRKAHNQILKANA